MVGTAVSPLDKAQETGTPVVFKWPIGRRITVTRLQYDGGQGCALWLESERHEGFELFTRDDDSGVRFDFENGRQWNGVGEPVTLWIDGQNYELNMSGGQNLLFADQQDTVGENELVAAIRTGHALRVEAPGAAPADFSLAGAAEAFKVLNRCHDTIVAQANARAAAVASGSASAAQPDEAAQQGRQPLPAYTPKPGDDLYGENDLLSMMNPPNSGGMENTGSPEDDEFHPLPGGYYITLGEDAEPPQPAATGVQPGAVEVPLDAHAYTYLPTEQDRSEIAACVQSRTAQTQPLDCVMPTLTRIMNETLTESQGKSWSNSQVGLMIHRIGVACGVTGPSTPPTEAQKRCALPEMRKMTFAITGGLAYYLKSIWQ